MNKKIEKIILATVLSSPSVYAHATQLPIMNVTEQSPHSSKDIFTTDALSNTGNTETGASLRNVPGVEASRMGGHGLDIFIRGQQQSQLNILIDGAKFEGGCPNRMDPPTSYAEMSSMDRIEVIKGIRSVTYGSGGSGGTVLFERSAPEFQNGKPYQGEINLGTSNNGLKQDLSATVSAGGERGYIVLQGAKKSAENYEDGNGNEIKSSYNTRQAHLDLGWTPTKNHELRLSLENSLTEDALFHGAMMDSPKSEGSTTRLRYKGKNLSDNISALNIDLYRSNVDHVMDNYTLRNTPASDMKNVTDVVSKGLKIQASTMLASTVLDYGIQYEGVEKLADLQSSSGMTAWYMWPDVETSTKSVFAEATKRLSEHQNIIMGLRYDQYSASENLANTMTTKGKAMGLYQSTYNNFSGETDVEQSALNGLIRYENQLNKVMRLFAGFSRTHRFADATELYINKGAKSADGTANTSWVGNPDLAPEQHNQIDIGLSGESKNKNWSVSAFYDSIHDYILRDIGNAQTASLTSPSGELTDKRQVYLNKDAVITGIETDLMWVLSNNLDVSANASYTKGRNTTDNRNLSNIMPFTGNLQAVYTASNWATGLRWNFATDQTNTNEEYGELDTPDWSTVDVYGDHQINRLVTLSAGVDNLFDKAYEHYLNKVDISAGNQYKLAETGRTVWAKMSAKF